MTTKLSSMTSQTKLSSSTTRLVTHTMTTLQLVTWITHEPVVTPCATLVADTWLVTTRTRQTSVFPLTAPTTDTRPSQQVSSPLPTLPKLSLEPPTAVQQDTTVHTATTGTNTRLDVTQTSICHPASSSTTSRSPLTVTIATTDSVSAVSVTST